MYKKEACIKSEDYSGKISSVLKYHNSLSNRSLFFAWSIEKKLLNIK